MKESVRYVQIIGTIWQFLYFTKVILSRAGYNKGIRLLVNMVGTNDTILAEFSREHAEDKNFWIDPFLGFGRGPGLFELRCPDRNLQIERHLVIGTLDVNTAKQVVVSIAEQLALAYNHGSTLRCFNYETEEFPWEQYVNVRSWR